MAVFRVEKTRDYTVMANHHLRNTALSLKAKGLLSLMLSLPETWDYTTKGLATICKDGVDSICATVRELENNGYVTRRRIRNDKGQLTITEYTILEQPIQAGQKLDQPKRENPVLASPVLDKPEQAEPVLEKTAQLNTQVLSTQKLNTHDANPYQSNPNQRYQTLAAKETGLDGIGYDTMAQMRETVMGNIEYDCIRTQYNHERLDEIVDLMTEMLCSAKSTINVAGDDYPSALVKEKLLRLNSMHIEYIFECLDKNRTYVRNIKKYMLAALFNAPSTIDSYYDALVRHDGVI